MINKAFAPALLALALSACAVGPDYKAPTASPRGSLPRTPATTTAPASKPSGGNSSTTRP